MIRRKRDLLEVKKRLRTFPVVAILGARQCGKTTLAREVAFDHYLDLENPRDLARLANPQLALEDLQGTIVIDEIQRRPDLFPLIRYLVDRRPHRQTFLILGSASRDLIRQSSESLAGRIAYYHLGGFRIEDVGPKNLSRLWNRGAFPRSFISKTEEESRIWRENYISTFLERDIPQLGIQIPSRTLRKFWMMLSHYHGQIVNFSELGRSFGMSDVTNKKYVEILTGTFMVRTLQPWYANVGKRIVKNPKIYIRDSGIFHSLQSIHTSRGLTTHPKLGASWEGFSIQSISQMLSLRDEELFFWRTHAGAELDLFWKGGGENWGIEIKYADAPRITPSYLNVMEDLKIRHLWVVYPGKESYKLGKNITVIPLTRVQEEVTQYHAK